MIRLSVALALVLAMLQAPPAAGQDGQASAESGSDVPESAPESDSIPEPDSTPEPESTPESAAASEAEAEAEAEAGPLADGEEEEIDDADLDEQTYAEDEDDFVPTEEIPADEPIPFPSNI